VAKSAKSAKSAPKGGVPASADRPTPAPTIRSVDRMLQMKGLTPAEAASLTAFLCGLPTTDLRWSLKQLNQLLFLRRLRQTGRFGDDDGRSGPH